MPPPPPYIYATRLCSLGENWEWQYNGALEGTMPGRKYYDLYHCGEYQHVWICHTPAENAYYLCQPNETLGTYTTFEDADKHVTAAFVARRFKNASI